MTQAYDVRIMEMYGRERILAEFRKVTKEEALVMLGGALISGRACHGSHTWVAPVIFVRKTDNQGEWTKQRREVGGKAVRAFLKHAEFTKVIPAKEAGQ